MYYQGNQLQISNIQLKYTNIRRSRRLDKHENIKLICEKFEWEIVIYLDALMDVKVIFITSKILNGVISKYFFKG